MHQNKRKVNYFDKECQLEQHLHMGPKLAVVLFRRYFDS